MIDKKNPSLRGGYNKRYARVFEGRYFCFFDPDGMTEPRGTVDLSTVKTVEELPTGE